MPKLLQFNGFQWVEIAKNGRDGNTPSKGFDYFDGIPGKDGSPDTGKEIVAKVNDLPIEPELQIDAKHIKNLPKEGTRGAKFRGGISLAWMETPSGAVNGTNTVFTLAFTPKSGQLMFFVNGQLLSTTDDYTVSGATVTLNTAPPANPPSVVRATYEKQ